MKRACITATLLLLLQVAAMPAQSPTQALEDIIPVDPGILEIENRILDLTNEMRKKEGLAPLKAEPLLAEIARRHSQDMIDKDYMAHVNKEGLAPWDRVSAGHRTLIGVVGENIHMSAGLDVTDHELIAKTAIEWWMNSPGHRANILKKEYTHLGVGVAIKGNKVLATQKFADVYAYIDEPLPATVKEGDALNLKATPAKPDLNIPNRFYFYNNKKDKVAAGPFPIEGAKADVKPGEYVLKFFFPNEDNTYFVIIDGPSIVVEK